MPVRVISSCWSLAIQSLPSRAAARSSSRAGEKPSRMMPPSFKARGGSSTTARLINSTRSGAATIWRPNSVSKGARGSAAGALAKKPSAKFDGRSKPASRDWIAGRGSSAWRRARRSRPLPVPVLKRPTVRSRSRTCPSCARQPARAAGSASQVWTASCRRAMAVASARGWDNQSRKRRAPMGVAERLRAPKSVAARGASRCTGSNTSKCRRVVVSNLRKSPGS